MENLSGENLSNLSQAVVRLAHAAATLSTAAQAMVIAAEFFTATTLNFKSKDSDCLAAFEPTVAAAEVAVDEQELVPKNPTPDDPPINSSAQEGTKDEPQHEERPGADDKGSRTSGKNTPCIFVYTITYILAEHVHLDFLSAAMANIKVDDNQVYKPCEAVKVRVDEKPDRPLAPPPPRSINLPFG
jgi:hypothetical protein